ncbi:MAG: hypothetical protein J0H62_03065 [Rhizobiales bacterium]|nr:hypothetical protein [Hyphomicrobiales bacterium]
MPLSAGTDPNNTIVGIDFSGGPASVAAQVASALGADFTVSNPSGSTLRILDDGGVAVSMTSASATRTASGFSSGGAALPLFVDSQGLYSGAVTSGSAQIRGFAGRISVNAAVVADPSKLVMMSGTTAAGDATRPSFILDQLTQASLSVTVPGAGGASSPTMQTTLSGFLRQVIVQQGQDAAAASSLQQGQQVVVDSLRQRMSEKSSVSIDEEMTQLLALQSAYSANARVLSAVKEMLDTLSRI